MAKPRLNMAETDNEALETLSRWWYQYAQYAAAALLLALGGFGGWYGWDYHRQSLAAEAAAHYAGFAQALETRLSSDTPPDLSVLQSYDDTPYLSFAYLRRAQHFIDNDQLSAAVEDLRWVAENSVQAVLSELAYIRLVRVLISMGNIAEASSVLLEPVFSNSFVPLAEELRGDIAVKSNNFGDAARSYRAAWDASVTRSNFLRLKLESLGQRATAGEQ